MRKLIVALVVGALEAGAAETEQPTTIVVKLRSQPVPAGQVLRGYDRFTARVGKTAIPKGVTPPTIKADETWYGYVYTKPSRQLALLKSPGSSHWNCLVIDQNGDKDLSNDPVLTFDKPDAVVEGSLRIGERELPVRIKVRDGKRVSLEIKPATQVAGELVLGQTTTPLVLVDRNRDGICRLGDGLWLDFNGDGKLNHSKEFSCIARLVRIVDVFYELELEEDVRELRLTPYQGPMGKVALAGSVLEQLAGSQVYFTLGFTEPPKNREYFGLTAGLDEVPLSLPAQAYRLYGCSIFLRKPRRSVSFKRGKLEIIAGQTLTLALEEPTMSLTVSQKGKTLNVGQATKGTDGIVFQRIMGRDTSYKDYQLGPKVEVSRLETPDRPLTTGNMRYG